MLLINFILYSTSFIFSYDIYPYRIQKIIKDNNNNLNVNNITYEKCCDGKVCSDTYYLEVDNKCHLTQCPFKKECIYEGKQ